MTQLVKIKTINNLDTDIQVGPETIQEVRIIRNFSLDATRFLVQVTLISGRSYYLATEDNEMYFENRVDAEALRDAFIATIPSAGTDLVASDIPSLDASKITTGTFAEARIPALAPSKITQDANNRFVTDTEKSTWNGKQNTLAAGDGIGIVGNVISVTKEVYTKVESDNKYATKEQEAWITPTLLNDATGTLRYRKDNFGRVWFKGTVNIVSDELPFASLPVGYKPLQTIRFPLIKEDDFTLGYVTIQPSGSCFSNVGDNRFDNVSFPTN